MQEEPLGSRGVSGSTQDWSWYKMHGHIMILSKARLRHYDGAWVGIGRPPISLYRMPSTSLDAKNKNWSHQAFFRFFSWVVCFLLCPREVRFVVLVMRQSSQTRPHFLTRTAHSGPQTKWENTPIRLISPLSFTHPSLTNFHN